MLQKTSARQSATAQVVRLTAEHRRRHHR
eukprot:COSAG03_NODE_19887_length_328_cov_0.777293_1_plen_28_part_01